MLSTEQLALYNAPPSFVVPLPPPLRAPPAINKDSEDGASDGADAIHANGAPPASEPTPLASTSSFGSDTKGYTSADDDDGAVRCEVTAPEAGRRTCHMCFTSIFNVCLRAEGRGSIDGDTPFDICTDCWSAAVTTDRLLARARH